MSETPSRQAVIVGLFVTIGIAIFAGGVLTIGGLDEAFRRSVRVTAVFDDVSGLQTGDAVWFSGVPVGTVRDVRFDGGPQVEVELAIAAPVTAYIHADATARIGTDGLIGNPIVVVSPGTSSSPSITQGAVLGSEDTVSTEEMLAMLQENNANLLAITEDLRRVSGRIAAGEGSVGRLLADDRLYADVRAAVDTLRDASANAEVLTANLAAFAGKLNQPESLPSQLVTDREIYASLTATVERLREVADDAGRVVDGLERGANDPATPLGTLLHDRAAGGDLKQTLEQLNASSQLLAEDLEALQHNFLLRGAVRRMERQRREAQEAQEAQDAGRSAAPAADPEPRPDRGDPPEG